MNRGVVREDEDYRSGDTFRIDTRIIREGEEGKKKVNRRIGALLRLYCAAFRDKDLLPI